MGNLSGIAHRIVFECAKIFIDGKALKTELGVLTSKYHTDTLDVHLMSIKYPFIRELPALRE